MSFFRGGKNNKKNDQRIAQKARRIARLEQLEDRQLLAVTLYTTIDAYDSAHGGADSGAYQEIRDAYPAIQLPSEFEKLVYNDKGQVDASKTIRYSIVEISGEDINDGVLSPLFSKDSGTVYYRESDGAVASKHSDGKWYIGDEQVNVKNLQSKNFTSAQENLIAIVATDSAHNTITYNANNASGKENAAGVVVGSPQYDFWCVAWGGSLDSTIPLTIDGQNQYRCLDFDCTHTDGTIGLANITMKNGAAATAQDSQKSYPGYGAGFNAHHVQQHLILEHCTFDSNTAEKGGGGLFYTANHDADEPMSSRYNSSLELKDCVFNNNTAPMGAAYSDMALGSNVVYNSMNLNETFDACLFTNNQGALSIFQSQAEPVFVSSAFAKNDVSGYYEVKNDKGQIQKVYNDSGILLYFPHFVKRRVLKNTPTG